MRTTRETLRAAMVMLLTVNAATLARAVDTYAVEYLLHEVPCDPESPVVFSITLKLTPEAASGDRVGWHVAGILFQQIDADGEVAREWYASEATVHTTDGLWWQTHADVENPTLTEFTLPPLVEGVAPGVLTDQPSLRYSFEGSVYLPPLDGPAFPVTAAITASLSSPELIMNSPPEPTPTRVRPGVPD